MKNCATWTTPEPDKIIRLLFNTCAASLSAAALPRPDAPPVTSATTLAMLRNSTVDAIKDWNQCAEDLLELTNKWVELKDMGEGVACFVGSWGRG